MELTNLYIIKSFQMCQEGISLVFKCVDKVQVCNAIGISKSIVMSRYHILDSWQSNGNSSVRSIRSLMCMNVVHLNSKVFCCRICQKMTFHNSEA